MCVYIHIYMYVYVYTYVYIGRGGRVEGRGVERGERGKEEAGIWRSEWSIVAFERMNESESLSVMLTLQHHGL